MSTTTEAPPRKRNSEPVEPPPVHHHAKGGASEAKANEAPAAAATAAAPVVTPFANPPASPVASPTGARKAVHFAGPVVSGHKTYLQGQAVLCMRFDVDKSTGNFTGGTAAAPGTSFLLDTGVILWKTITSVTQAFDGTTPKVNIGTTSGGSEIASIALGTAGAPAEAAALAAPTAGTTLYVSLTGGPFTTGHASVVLLFIGPAALPWN